MALLPTVFLVSGELIAFRNGFIADTKSKSKALLACQSYVLETRTAVFVQNSEKTWMGKPRAMVYRMTIEFLK